MENNIHIIYSDSDYVHLSDNEELSIEDIPIFLEGNGVYWVKNRNLIPSGYVWNNLFQMYIPEGIPVRDQINPRTLWVYPIPKCYNLNKIDSKYIKLNPKYTKNTQVESLFKYTFGFEFETSNGTIPFKDCISTGLVPLFDGSITGYEYVTDIINSESLISALTQIHNVLLKFTTYDRNCSVHMHIGGFPVTINAVKALLKYWYKFQTLISVYLPHHVYNTELYKRGGKSYCKPYSKIVFSRFYTEATGNLLENDESLYLLNQYDATQDHKWTVNSRYYNMNIVHMISGRSPKTIEFRFLPCTKNYYELELWVVLLALFVKFVNDIYEKDSLNTTISVNKVISPLTLYQKALIKKKLSLLYYLRKLRFNMYDLAGLHDTYKDLIINNTKFNTSIFKCVD